MDTSREPKTQDQAQVIPLSMAQRFGQWIQDPLGGVVAASVATIGSFGVVLSGMWAINLAIN